METAIQFLLRCLSEEGRDDLVQAYHEQNRQYQQYCRDQEKGRRQAERQRVRDEIQQELQSPAQEESQEKRDEFAFDREFNKAQQRMSWTSTDLGTLVNMYQGNPTQEKKKLLSEYLQQVSSELERIKTML